MLFFFRVHQVFEVFECVEECHGIVVVMVKFPNHGLDLKVVGGWVCAERELRLEFSTREGEKWSL